MAKAGFLPRASGTFTGLAMTGAARNALSPAPGLTDAGLLCFVNDNATAGVPLGLYVWDGTAWEGCSSGSSGALTVNSRALWVDGTTTAATAAQTGSQGNPFKTLALANAAITAAPTRFVGGVVINLAPGIYVEQVVVPDLTMTSYSIVGLDRASTILRQASASTVLQSVAIVGTIVAMRFSCLRIDQAGAGSTVLLNGTGLGAGHGYLGTGAEFDDCLLTTTGTGATFNNCGLVFAYNGQFQGATVFTQCGSAFVRAVTLAGVDAGFDIAVAAPTGGRGTLAFASGTTATAVVLRTQAAVAFDRTTQVTSVTGTGLSVGALSMPAIAFAGTITGAWAMNGANALPTPAGTASVVTLDYSRWLAGSTLLLAQTALGTGLLTVSARLASFQMTAGGSISAGGSIVLNMLGSSFNEGALTVASTGTIDRDQATIASAAYTAAGVAKTWVVPFPATKTAADFNFMFQPSAWGATATGFQFSAISDTGFTLASITAMSSITGVVTARRITGTS